MNRTIPIRLLVVSLVFLLAPSARAAKVDADFYVATDGDDANPGTFEKPFATIAKARDAARAMIKGKYPIVVVLRGGTYYLAEPVVFRPEDSGTKDGRIVYVACWGETPVISGGAKLDLEWEPYKDGIMQAKVPEGIAFDQLFVDGAKQHLARSPMGQEIHAAAEGDLDEANALRLETLPVLAPRARGRHLAPLGLQEPDQGQQKLLDGEVDGGDLENADRHGGGEPPEV